MEKTAVIPARTGFAIFGFIAPYSADDKGTDYEHILNTVVELKGSVKKYDRYGGITVMFKVDRWLLENKIKLPKREDGSPGKADDFALFKLSVPIDHAKTLEYMIQHEPLFQKNKEEGVAA